MVDLNAEIRLVKTFWQFHVLEGLNARCTVCVDYMRDRGISLEFLRRL